MVGALAGCADVTRRAATLLLRHNRCAHHAPASVMSTSSTEMMSRSTRQPTPLLTRAVLEALGSVIATTSARLTPTDPEPLPDAPSVLGLHRCLGGDEGGASLRASARVTGYSR